MQSSSPYRLERDSLGGMQVPAGLLYGASTARAVANFPISGVALPPPLVIRALGQLKLAAARANKRLGVLDEQIADAVALAAEQVVVGVVDMRNFPVDVFQTGSGTSSNMNVNEVIANIASRQLEGDAEGACVHPNDHVNNAGQSSNDAIPAAVRLAAAGALHDALIPSLRKLARSLRQRAHDTWNVLHPARTHLQDALPTRLGRLFLGHAAQLDDAIERLEHALAHEATRLSFGTAVGTAFGAHRDFSTLMVEDLRR